MMSSGSATLMLLTVMLVSVSALPAPNNKSNVSKNEAKKIKEEVSEVIKITSECLKKEGDYNITEGTIDGKDVNEFLAESQENWNKMDTCMQGSELYKQCITGECKEKYDAKKFDSGLHTCLMDCEKKEENKAGIKTEELIKAADLEVKDE